MLAERRYVGPGTPVHRQSMGRVVRESRVAGVGPTVDPRKAVLARMWAGAGVILARSNCSRAEVVIKRFIDRGRNH